MEDEKDEEEVALIKKMRELSMGSSMIVNQQKMFEIQAKFIAQKAKKIK